MLKYVIDNSLNRLAKGLKSAGIDADTSTFLIRGDNDSSKPLKDPKKFRHLLEQKYNLSIRNEWSNDATLITTDKDLFAYCEEFQIPCLFVKKPETKQGFKEMSAKLVKKLTLVDAGKAILNVQFPFHH